MPMPLPIFNLAKHIEKYNEAHQSNYALEEDFGFAYFENEMWQYTKAAVQSVNQGTDNYLLTQDERMALKKRNQYYQQYQSYLKGLNPEPTKLSEEAQAVVWAVYQKVQYWNWLHKRLSEWKKPETWQGWEVSLTFEKQFQLETLKHQWVQHMAFAHHSNKSLYTVSKKLIPALVQHQQAARRNLFFSFWKLPQPISRAYIDYCDDFLKEAKTLPAQIAASMLTRLQAFDKNRSSEGQPIIYLKQTLQSLGVNVSEENIPTYREPFTAKQFHFFHHYIEQNGDARTKASLKKLSWLNHPSEPLQLQKVTTPTETFLVPKVFEHDIPATPQKPISWFRGHHLRHTFFQTKGLFLVSLQDIPVISKVSIKRNHLSPVIDAWMCLQQKQDAILQELDECSKPIQPPLGFLQSKTREFLKKWNAYLVEQRTKILDSKLQLIERMTNHLQSFQDMGQTREIWSLCSLLKKFIKKLKADFIAYPDEKCAERLRQVEQRMKPFVSNHRLVRLIQDIAAGKTVSELDVQEVCEKMQLLKQQDSETHFAFLELCQPQLKQIAKMLDFEWKANPSELRHPERHAARLLRLNHVIASCGDVVLDLENQARITKQLPHYFLNYLISLWSCGTNGENAAHHQQASEMMEKILFSFESEHVFANKTIAEHVKELKALREKAIQQKDVWIFIHARSYAVADIVHSLYFTKRLKKDVAAFDEQLFSCIRQDKQLLFNDVTIQEIQQFSDHHIQQKKASLEDLSLAPEQKTILGFNGGRSAYVRDLLELRKVVHIEQQAILSSSLPLEKRVHRMQGLAREVNIGIQKIPASTQPAFFASSRSKHTELFTKTYINPALSLKM